MIEIECDNCEQRFSVDDAEAGGKAACPSCGDVNRVPAGVREGPGPSEPQRPRPERAAPVEADVERELAVVRPAMFRAHPLRYLLLLTMFLGGIAGAVASQISETVWPWLFWPAAFIAAASIGWFVSWWIGAHWWMKLIITNKRTVRHEGIVRRHTTEVLHDHVRSVDIEQSFLDRIMGVGAMGIDSAGQEDIEIQVRDIPRPYEVKKLIDRYRKL